jgi:hypothetical protein
MTIIKCPNFSTQDDVVTSMIWKFYRTDPCKMIPVEKQGRILNKDLTLERMKARNMDVNKPMFTIHPLTNYGGKTHD